MKRAASIDISKPSKFSFYIFYSFVMFIPNESSLKNKCKYEFTENKKIDACEATLPVRNLSVMD